jgi:hypothetical protein
LLSLGHAVTVEGVTISDTEALLAPAAVCTTTSYLPGGTQGFTTELKAVSSPARVTWVYLVAPLTKSIWVTPHTAALNPVPLTTKLPPAATETGLTSVTTGFATVTVACAGVAIAHRSPPLRV